MKPLSRKPDHWIVEMNWRDRTRFGVMILATLATHLFSTRMGWVAWSLLSLQFLAYLQIADDIARDPAIPARRKCSIWPWTAWAPYRAIHEGRTRALLAE